MQKVLLISPPFTQLNTPYPATAYLKGFLNTQKIESFQIDLGLTVILELFSAKKLEEIFEIIVSKKIKLSENSERILSLSEEYIQTIDNVVQFLQGENSTIAVLIAEGKFLPQASRFNELDDLEWAFGTMGTTDKARYFATLYLEDLADFITENIDANFGFSRYAEQLGRSARSFDLLNEELQNESTFIEKILLHQLNQIIIEQKPDVVGITVPFPGNLYCAFKSAQFIKKNFPDIKIILGGGFPNTELRSLTDKRVFDYFDFITLDDGERPLLCILNYLEEKIELNELKRTFILSDNQVKYCDGSKENDFPQRLCGTPDYSDLYLKKYLSVIEIANPMHRLWSDGRWNKLTLAHGCYWGKCTFCDISLDYIGRYEPLTAQLICDRIEEIILQTGETGFHFVDEAAPPALMKEVALEILRRKISISWWTNIRFEKSFTADLCRLLSASGCVAVSGGLEVASNRLLQLIDKGVSVEQVAKVTANFTDAGIMVHAYLMYGYPTQTAQETIDSLEIVRQLFENGIVQSGFWHRFALTAHSPIGLNSSKYGIKIVDNSLGKFANNDLEFNDEIGCDHSVFSEGLRKSLFNYMHGIGFDFNLSNWFEGKVPKTKVKSNYIEEIINALATNSPLPNYKCIWLGKAPLINSLTSKKIELKLITKNNEFILKLDKEKGEWLLEILNKLRIDSNEKITYAEFADNYQSKFNEPIEMFLHSTSGEMLRENGLLFV